jgi:hypothetical protein
MMWGLSEEAGVLQAGAQPMQAISLLLAKLVRHSAPYPFLSYLFCICFGNVNARGSTMDNETVTRESHIMSIHSVS